MPGAFAHITLVDVLVNKNSLTNLVLHPNVISALCRQVRFCEVGAVSPDFPYLHTGSEGSARWADLMHYQHSVDVIRNGLKAITTVSDNAREKALSWLFGYAAHVVTDVTIHPIVYLRVGPYDQNKAMHRDCEMHQDVFIWGKYRPNLGAISECEKILNNIGNNGVFDPGVKLFWEGILQKTYPEEYAKNLPDIDAWQKWFVQVVDLAEETASFIPLSRHIIKSKGVLYPEVPDDSYIVDLKIPGGALMHYEDVFKKAISNVGAFWKKMSDAIYLNDFSYFDGVGNWNLDTGEDIETHQKIFWSE